MKNGEYSKPPSTLLLYKYPLHFYLQSHSSNISSDSLRNQFNSFAIHHITSHHMASIAIQVPSPRSQGPESLFMRLAAAALTPKRSPLAAAGGGGGSKGTKGEAISSAKMSEIRIDNSINTISPLVATRPPPTEGPGGQSN
ncbi:hypothetical protein L6164_022688 [Bauhinia variegata]|uniref:Uncharacterized protein n=1 Tax=Bauhinia variegata TaxID=167791 RepID=A0ACB9MH98_BAUVA|nr:hypothetical protein L6164_022688 [Bauhinia variegata]